MSTEEIAPAAPLPLRRRRRLSIQEFTSPDPPRRISTYRQLFGKPAEVQHLLTRSSTSPETSTLLPRFHERLLGRHDVQSTAIQEKCPLLAKLPLELRLQIYGYVLGGHTLHIIPSHVPSLELPPRFSLRAYPFHRRLDFEVCKNPKSHLGFKESYESCTREYNKRDDLAILTGGSFSDTKEHASRRTKAMLQKYERKGGPLALLKTCRLIYSEAIEVIYTTNAFSFSTLTTFLLFNTLLLPSRLHNLQHLVLQFSVPFSPIVHCKQIYRPANIEWPRACAFLRTLPSLHTLTLSLKGPPIYWTGSDALGQNDSPLKQLSGVKVKREYIVFVDWRVQEVEKTLETEFGMKVLGRERVNWQEEYRS